MPRTSPYPYELPAGQTTAWPAAPGTVLQVLNGRLWVTCTGDSSDHFLHPGDRLPLNSGRVVLEADTAQTARYRLVSAEHSPNAEWHHLPNRTLKFNWKWV